MIDATPEEIRKENVHIWSMIGASVGVFYRQLMTSGVPEKDVQHYTGTVLDRMLDEHFRPKTNFIGHVKMECPNPRE